MGCISFCIRTVIYIETYGLFITSDADIDWVFGHFSQSYRFFQLYNKDAGLTLTFMLIGFFFEQYQGTEVFVV